MIILINFFLAVHKYRARYYIRSDEDDDVEIEVIRPLDPLELQFCQEDRERVQDILNLDTKGSRSRMFEFFYKSILRPVQTGCKKIRRIGESSSREDMDGWIHPHDLVWALLIF